MSAAGRENPMATPMMGKNHRRYLPFQTETSRSANVSKPVRSCAVVFGRLAAEQLKHKRNFDKKSCLKVTLCKITHFS